MGWWWIVGWGLPGLAGDCPPQVTALTLPDILPAADARLRSPHLVVIRKGARRLARYREGRLVERDGAPACWPIGLGTPVDGRPAEGPKLRQGDHRTPEGWYRTSDKPWSQFYAAIAVHYPNSDDAHRGQVAGVIDVNRRHAIERDLAADRMPDPGSALGGDILIHGGGSSSDWTLGCIALDDAHIDRLRASLPTDMRFDLLILP